MFNTVQLDESKKYDFSLKWSIKMEGWWEIEVKMKLWGGVCKDGK